MLTLYRHMCMHACGHLCIRPCVCHSLATIAVSLATIYIAQLCNSNLIHIPQLTTHDHHHLPGYGMPIYEHQCTLTHHTTNTTIFTHTTIHARLHYEL